VKHVRLGLRKRQFSAIRGEAREWCERLHNDLVMLMKEVVHNLPRPIDFEEREQVSEAVAVPVIEFQPDPSNRVDDVDTDDPGVEPCGWGILVHFVKEELDRASKELPIGIAEDGRVLVEGGFHLGASASLRTIDIMLDRLGNRLILA
jgi:hypothetical protein